MFDFTELYTFYSFRYFLLLSLAYRFVFCFIAIYSVLYSGETVTSGDFEKFCYWLME